MFIKRKKYLLWGLEARVMRHGRKIRFRKFEQIMDFASDCGYSPVDKGGRNSPLQRLG